MKHGARDRVKKSRRDADWHPMRAVIGNIQCNLVELSPQFDALSLRNVCVHVRIDGKISMIIMEMS